MNARKVLAASLITVSTWGFGAGVANAQSSLSVGGVVDSTIDTVNGVTGQLPVQVPPVVLPDLPVIPNEVPSLPTLPPIAVPSLPALPSVPMPAAPALPARPDAPSVSTVANLDGLTITLDLSSIGFGIQHFALPIGASAVVADVMTMVQDWTRSIVNSI